MRELGRPPIVPSASQGDRQGAQAKAGWDALSNRAPAFHNDRCKLRDLVEPKFGNAFRHGPSANLYQTNGHGVFAFEALVAARHRNQAPVAACGGVARLADELWTTTRAKEAVDEDDGNRAENGRRLGAREANCSEPMRSDSRTRRLAGRARDRVTTRGFARRGSEARRKVALRWSIF